MFIQLTTAGLSLLASGPFVLTGAKFGDSYNYVPDPGQTDILGSEVFSSVPGPAFPINPNVVRYSLLLDRSVGDFDFGELGLFVGSTLVAIGVNSTLIEKRKTVTGVDGNMIRVNAFLSMVGTTYEMWMNLGDTDNKYVIASADLVDYLPPVHDTATNAFIVGAPSQDMLAFFAYADRSGLWAFDQYKYSTVIGHRYTIVDASPMQVTIAGTNHQLDPESLGARILQFTTGACYSVCRNIAQALPDLSAGTTVLQLNTALAVVPTPGDEILVYNRDPLATTTVNIPIATTQDPGIMIVGQGLDVDVDGLVKVDRTEVEGGLVYSIIGRDVNGDPISLQGDVQLNIRDIAGGVVSVNGQTPDANGNISITVGYTLPIATSTVLGGVRVSPGSGIDIDPQTGQVSVTFPGDSSVKSVNGRAPDSGGNVQIYGLIDPQVRDTAVDLNTIRDPGLYYIKEVGGSSNLPLFVVPTESGVLEVIPLDPDDPDGLIVQRWSQSNATAWRFVLNSSFGPWFDPSQSQQIIATDSRLGSVVVGDGLSIDPTGVLSSDILTVNTKGPDVNGNVQLDAPDVGAIASSEKGVPGGVAVLDEDPDPTPPDPGQSDYVFGRIPADALALEALTFKGYWNGTTNEAVYEGLTYTLLDGGQLLIDDGISGSQVPGLGSVFYTSVAGSTTVDGVGSWELGDFVVGLTDRWVKLSSVGAVPLQHLHVSMSIPDTIAPSSVLFFQVVGVSVSSTSGSKAVARTPSTDTVVFDIEADGTQIGTITFDSSDEGVVDIPPVSLAADAVLTITSPSNLHSLYGLAVNLVFEIDL